MKKLISIILISAIPAFALDVGDINFQGSVTGLDLTDANGSGITNLNASNLATGTVPDARIDATIARDSELHDAVTTSGAGTYISLTGQDLQIDVIDVSTADITGTLPIGNLPVGTAGQQLTVNEGETALEFGLASKYITARKGSSGTIDPGTPVYLSGFSVGQTAIEVEIADNSAAGTMPALGLAFDSLTSGANGRVLISGFMDGLDTSSWSAGDPLYISDVVGSDIPWLTNVKPTGSSLIQKVAIVSRSNPSNGSIVIQGAGRNNDLPNIANTKIWIGDANGVPQEFALSGDATMTAGGVVSVVAASETASGIVEKATDAEASAGTDTNRFVTPAQLSTYGGGGGGVSDVLETWTAPQANLVVSSPMTLGFSTNAQGQIVYHLDADRTTAEYSRFGFQRVPGLDTNMNVVVRAFGASGDVFTVISQELGQSAVTSATKTLTATDVDVDNLVTVICTNGITGTSVDEYGRVYFDLTISLTNDHSRAGDISISEVMILQSAP